MHERSFQAPSVVQDGWASRRSESVLSEAKLAALMMDYAQAFISPTPEALEALLKKAGASPKVIATIRMIDACLVLSQTKALRRSAQDALDLSGERVAECKATQVATKEDYPPCIATRSGHMRWDPTIRVVQSSLCS
jgi:hypothetical protein